MCVCVKSFRKDAVKNSRSIQNLCRTMWAKHITESNQFKSNFVHKCESWVNFGAFVAEGQAGREVLTYYCNRSSKTLRL